MEPIRVAFILSVCFHLLLLGVSSIFSPQAHVYSTPYIVTLIREESKKPQTKSPKVIKTLKKKHSSVKNKPKKKQRGEKKNPEVSRTTLPKSKKSKKKVKKTKKDPAIEKSYKEVQKAVSQIQQKEKQKLVRQSVEDIQRKLLKQEMAALQEEQIAAREQTNFFLKAYHSQVWNLIKSHWLIPDSGYDKGKKLLTVISIRIGKDGSILDIKFESKSGEPVFDRSALMAIKRVGNFPPFPPEMNMDSIEIGVRFFPPEE